MFAGDELYDDVTSGLLPEPPCPASREAVEEQQDAGEVGCPLCGASAEHHESEGS